MRYAPLGSFMAAGGFTALPAPGQGEPQAVDRLETFRAEVVDGRLAGRARATSGTLRVGWGGGP